MKTCSMYSSKYSSTYSMIPLLLALAAPPLPAQGEAAKKPSVAEQQFQAAFWQETGKGDLTLAGFVRLEGWVGPYTLTRAYNGEDGSPVGYDLVTGIDHLNQRYRKIYTDLLDTFRFRDLKEHALAGSSATTFLRNCMALGLLSKSKSGEYQKIGEKG